MKTNGYKIPPLYLTFEQININNRAAEPLHMTNEGGFWRIRKFNIEKNLALCVAQKS